MFFYVKLVSITKVLPPSRRNICFGTKPLEFVYDQPFRLPLQLNKIGREIEVKAVLFGGSKFSWKLLLTFIPM